MLGQEVGAAAAEPSASQRYQGQNLHQAAESSSLMKILALVALRSAWFGQRRTHLVAKHHDVAIL